MAITCHIWSLIGFDLIGSDLIRRFNWSKVYHSRPNSGAARFELIAELEAISGEVRKEAFRRSCKLAFWRGFEWLLRQSWMMLASQARISPWAHVMLNASIVDLLRSV